MSFLFLILTGFLLSRLGVRYALIERFFARGLAHRHDSVTSFLLTLMAATALISIFIPNFITALALLPILENLRRRFEQQHSPKLARRLTTAMVLAAIYGCNIGGMGSLIGSPANALMLGVLEWYQTPAREKINFLSWFGWSLPLTAILIGCAWAQLVYVILPRAAPALNWHIHLLKTSRQSFPGAPDWPSGFGWRFGAHIPFCNSCCPRRLRVFPCWV